MVATVDGRASVDGRTAPLSSVADRQFFHALRTRVDAVLVGAGTLRTERCGRLGRAAHRRDRRVANGLTSDPLAIVVSGSLDLPATLPLLQDPASRVVLITAAEASLEGCAAHVEYLRASPGRSHHRARAPALRARRAFDSLRGRAEPEHLATREACSTSSSSRSLPSSPAGPERSRSSATRR
jgi:riboflavin biosynthesis pyrimidine reductase